MILLILGNIERVLSGMNKIKKIKKNMNFWKRSENGKINNLSVMQHISRINRKVKMK
jgi:hypothetical protein